VRELLTASSPVGEEWSARKRTFKNPLSLRERVGVRGKEN
jgi:hypothetical protein